MSNGHLDIVSKLIKEGADVNLNDENSTPLTVSCSAGNLNIVQKLIEAGVDVNLNDGEKHHSQQHVIMDI